MQNIIRQSLLNTIGPVLIPEFLPQIITKYTGESHSVAKTPVSHAVSDDSLSGEITKILALGTDNVYAEALGAMERFLLTKVLEQYQGNLSQCARRLGITRGSLRNKIRSLGMQIDKTVKIEDGDNDE